MPIQQGAHHHGLEESDPRQGHWPSAVTDRQTTEVAQQLCPVIVGREAELDTLRQALTAAVGGQGRCVMLLGEPGIGKSRLARELASWAVDQGMSVLGGRAVPAAGSAAYLPLTEALMQLFRTRPLPHDPELSPWLPLLQPLLPTLVEGAPVPANVPLNRRGEALLQLLSRANATGLALILEDLHWARCAWGDGR